MRKANQCLGAPSCFTPLRLGRVHAAGRRVWVLKVLLEKRREMRILLYEPHGTPRVGTGQCVGGQGSRLGRGLALAT